jgi:hypothetical protein
MRSRSSNNINFLVLRLCERMATYKHPLIDQGVLDILDFMLGELEDEIQIRPLLWIRTDLLDVICSFIFRQGGFDLRKQHGQSGDGDPQLNAMTTVIASKAESVIDKLKNLLVKDSLRWETVSVNSNLGVGLVVDDDSEDGNSRREWEEFWEDYLWTDYIS